MRRLAALCALLCLTASGCGLSSDTADDQEFLSPTVTSLSERCFFDGLEQEFLPLCAAAQPLTISKRRQTDGYKQWWDSEFCTADGNTAQIQLLFDIRNQCSCTIYDGQLQYSINTGCGSPLGLYRADLNTEDEALDLLYWERLNDNSTRFQIFRYDGTSLYLAGILSGAPDDVFTDLYGTYVCTCTDLVPFTAPCIALSYYRESGYILVHPPTQMANTFLGKAYSMKVGCWYFDTETPYDPNTLETYETAYLAGGKDMRRHMRVFTGEEQVTILRTNSDSTIYYCEIDGERGALCLFE